MNLSRGMTAATRSVLFLVILSMSAFAFAQGNTKNKQSSPPPAKSSPPPSAPAHTPPPSGAAKPPATNPQHPAGAPGSTAAGHQNMGTNAAHGANTVQGKPGTTSVPKTGVGANNVHGTGAGANAHGTGTAGGANAHNTNATHGASAAHRGPPTTTKEIKTRSGATVQANFRGGKVRSITAHNMKIERGLHGERRIVTEHNGRRVVTMGRGRGYMERPYFNRGGRTYIQRTYYVNGRPYAYAYRGYYYHGVRYYGYAPAYYYHPVYYGWAYNPWPAPVYYRWPYYNDPWYGYYGYYYQPYPAYPTASYWVTDYMISENLRAAYLARLGKNLGPERAPYAGSQDLLAGLWSSDSLIAGSLHSTYPGFPAFASATPQAALSPEVKQALSEEVKQQIADEKSAAENSQQASGGGDETPPALNPKYKIFIVSSDLDVTTDDGDECSLSSGDIIERTADEIDQDNNVAVVVKSTKKEDCSVGTKAAVDANDLQEMHNHFRETLDAGLKELADKSGKDGLPKAPDTTTQGGEVPAPQPDPGVDNELNQQQKDADQTEAEVQQGAGSQ